MPTGYNGGVHRLAFTLLLAMTIPRTRRRWLAWALAAAVVASVANLPWLAAALPALRWQPPIPTGIQAGLTVALDLLALVLALVAVRCLLAREQSAVVLARRLARRGDHRGAGEAYLRAGEYRAATKEFTKARAWAEAARAALQDGQAALAASLFRKAGGELLEEAARIHRRLNETDAARECDAGLARWLASQNRLDDAVVAYVRAGDMVRAARLVRLALDANQLKANTRAFAAARRAAEGAEDHEALARLAELEGDHTAAGEAWSRAGRPDRAADCFRRAGRLERAADAEERLGRLEQATRIRLELANTWRKQLEEPALGADSPERVALQRKLAALEERLVRDLDGLGLTHELIDLLVASDRIEEATQRLIAQGDLERAADVAEAAQRWEVAAGLLEKTGQWARASDLWEVAGRLEKAARCAEYAGEDERARLMYRRLGDTLGEARCLARSGRLEEGVATLHSAGKLDEAWQLLEDHPGPLPNIPDAVQDLAEHLWSGGRRREAVACLQRAVVGVALERQRIGPHLALAQYLHRLGDAQAALKLLDRVIEFDYTLEAAHRLREGILAENPQLLVTAPQGGPTSPPSPQVAEQRYEIQDELGRGGMGVVYSAFDRELERSVAIKVLRTTREEEIERLREEAKAAARLDHPGIVRVYDLLQGFGGYFIVMELVNGRPLDELIRGEAEKRAVRAHLLEIAVQVAEAVAYAHSRRVVHRDLKPGNILVSDEWRTKILDFGIAARLDADTPSVAACGTPYYMAPEQILGEVPTPATDVYSLGATLYHLATGNPPFTRNIIDGHLKEKPEDPSTKDPNLSAGLSDVILRCLEKDPEARYPSAAELARALRALMPHAPHETQG